jgi:membrane protease YdiL (CAAX protease family)
VGLASTACAPPGSWVSRYWTESRRPLTALAFVAPLLVLYEAGVCFLGPQAVRNGADVWLRQFLVRLGFGQYFLLPSLAVAILLAWHYTTRQPWRLSRGVLASMVLESLLLAVCLRLILQLQGMLLQSIAGPCGQAVPAAAMAIGIPQKVRGLIGFLGAGVYEELLFRLIFLSLVGWVLSRILGKRGQPPFAGTAGRVLRTNGDCPLFPTLRPSAMVIAVVLTSLAFAAAHYVGPYGEPVHLLRSAFWFSFSFRFLAGIFFGTLFVYRGFGIAAGSHAGYDILVGLF